MATRSLTIARAPQTVISGNCKNFADFTTNVTAANRVPPGYCTGPSNVQFNLRIAKVIGFGKRNNGPAAQHDGGPDRPLVAVGLVEVAAVVVLEAALQEAVLVVASARATSTPSTSERRFRTCSTMCHTRRPMEH